MIFKIMTLKFSNFIRYKQITLRIIFIIPLILSFTCSQILVTHPRKSEISLEDPARIPLIVSKSSEAPLFFRRATFLQKPHFFSRKAAEGGTSRNPRLSGTKNQISGKGMNKSKFSLGLDREIKRYSSQRAPPFFCGWWEYKLDQARQLPQNPPN